MVLDLTAAFDTTDHNILICRLENVVGNKGIDLEWFRSYLTGIFLLTLETLYPRLHPFHAQPLKALFLEPILFSLYMLPGSIFRKYGILLYCCTDNTFIWH